MPYSFVVDTFTWVEYVIGSRRGKAAKTYIESGKASTPMIVLMETCQVFLREIESGRRTLQDLNQAFDFIRTTTFVVDLDEALARKVGEADFLMKKKVRNWPMAGSMVHATAAVHGSRVVTGDPHFKSVENSVII